MSEREPCPWGCGAMLREDPGDPEHMLGEDGERHTTLWDWLVGVPCAPVRREKEEAR